MKVIIPVVEKDAKVFMEELKESSMVIHFSGSSNFEDQ